MLDTDTSVRYSSPELMECYENLYDEHRDLRHMATRPVYMELRELIGHPIDIGRNDLLWRAVVDWAHLALKKARSFEEFKAVISRIELELSDGRP